jgi:integrase
VDRSKQIIEQWGTKPIDSENYVFPFLSEGLTGKQIVTKTDQVVKQTYKYIRRIAGKVGINESISSYWARHSFATVLKRSGVPTSFISDALGHSNPKVTEGYLDSFEDDARKQIMEKLTNLNS